MTSATTVSFDDEFISNRLLTFMHNGEYNGVPNGRTSFNELNMVGFPASAQKSFSLDKDGSLAMSNRSNPVTCNSPTRQVTNGYAVAPSHIVSKYTGGLVNSAFSTPNPSTKVIDDYHSLQNSPFYNHYPLNCPSAIKNAGDGMRSDLFSNNTDCPSVIPRRAPQRELFPSVSIPRCDSNWLSSMNASLNPQAPGLLMQDRLFYNSLAQKRGYIVGCELERIKENSRRSTSHTYGRISAHFRHRYGETEATTKASYMQLGVRVPSKDHVSEIVGKGGQKIKLIREETGALITTPGEYEDHVFIIEAPPEIALRVAELISSRAQEITQSKMSASERRRGSTSSIPGGTALFSVNSAISGLNGSSGGGGRLVSRSPDEIPSGSTSSPVPLLKTTGTSDNAFPFNNGLSSCTNGGPTGRILLARSKISVPQDMVGKIIGTQGSIITTIQKDTGTEIKSPPKEATRGPAATSDFEISAYQSLGMNSNQAAECRVQQAKQLIAHLVMRQFDRRASEEEVVAVNSAKSRPTSAGEDAGENGSASSRTSKFQGWMWPDVVQMDATEAREVLDRILAESKSKTRRAKELASVASATNGGSVPNSPGAPISGAFGNEFFPPEKTVTSCHNSPFHQPRVTMPPSGGSQSAYSQCAGTAQVNLLNGFISERRVINVEYPAYAGLSDHSLYSGGSSAFWPKSVAQPHSMACQSFSAIPSTECDGSGSPNSPPMSHRKPMVSDLIDQRSEQQQLLVEDFTALVKEGGGKSLVNATEELEEKDLDFIQALFSLCLNGDGPVINSEDLSYPPGFDIRRDKGVTSPAPDWSTKAFFSTGCGGGSDGLSDGSNNSDAVLRGIWADAPTGMKSGELFPSFSFTANPPSSVEMLPRICADTAVSNKCGAVGEGRRPSTPPNGVVGGHSEVKSVPAV